MPGLIVLVRTPSGDLRASAGFAVRERRKPIGVDHAFRIASNTKTFVAAATMKLVEQGVSGSTIPIPSRLPAPG